MKDEQSVEKYKKDLEYHKNKLDEAFQNFDFVKIEEQARCIAEVVHMINFYNKKDTVKGVGAWYETKKEIDTEYNFGRILQKEYDEKIKFPIGMIYKCGNKNDKEAAIRMAKAHGYNIEDLIAIVS